MPLIEVHGSSFFFLHILLQWLTAIVLHYLVRPVVRRLHLLRYRIPHFGVLVFKSGAGGGGVVSSQRAQADNLVVVGSFVIRGSLCFCWAPNQSKKQLRNNEEQVISLGHFTFINFV